MSSRIVRTTLTLLAVTSLGTAAYSYWTTLARINASLQNASALTQARKGATQAAYDLRSAQQAYVAAGQNEAFWFERATRSLDALRTALGTLQGQALSEAARASLVDVASAADDFEARDRRVRGYVSGGQKLLAADLIFSDGFDLTSRMVTGLDAAAAQAALDAAAARAAVLREQKIAVGAAAAVALLVVLVLAATGTPRTSPADDSHAGVAPTRDGMLNLEIRPERRSPKAMTAAARTGRAPVAQPDAGPAIALENLAAVCADLARLSDTGTIPAILERTAAALDAAGLVLWIGDGEGGQLLPIAAHGYAPSVLSRMRGLSPDSENATAAAFRTGLVQIVRSTDGTNGAIAAPLVSPAGPLGVLSLEMRNGAEKGLERQAAATIVASQLATIVGPPAARAEEQRLELG